MHVCVYACVSVFFGVGSSQAFQPLCLSQLSNPMPDPTQ